MIKKQLIYSDCENLTLENDGVEVVKDILEEKEVKILQQRFWEWLHFKTRHTKNPVIEKKHETYVSIFELFPKHGMLFQHWDFGHNPISWTIRQNKKVIDKFSSIWKTSDLITSFDGISVSLPPEITNRGWSRGEEWFHSDQCFKRNSFECVQGLVNIFDVYEKDATLRVLKGSHKLHSDFQNKFQIEKSTDWHLLNNEEKQFYIDHLGPDSDICVKAPAGSLVLWDSRTIHQGMEPQKERNQKSIRCTPYVCMVPRSQASENQIKKRIKYFEEQRTCNHWPHKIKVFGKKPRLYPGQTVPMVEKDSIEITDLMKKLVGYEQKPISLKRDANGRYSKI